MPREFWLTEFFVISMVNLNKSLMLTIYYNKLVPRYVSSLFPFFTFSLSLFLLFDNYLRCIKSNDKLFQYMSILNIKRIKQDGLYNLKTLLLRLFSEGNYQLLYWYASRIRDLRWVKRSTRKINIWWFPPPFHWGTYAPFTFESTYCLQ